MLEFSIGYIIGMSVTFVVLLLGSLYKEEHYEKKKTGSKSKKHSEDK